MKKTILTTMCVWSLLCQLASLFAQEDYTYKPSRLDKLTMEDCVHMFNDMTSLHINMELARPSSEPFYAVDVRDLNSNTTPLVVEAVLNQKNDYDLLRSGDVFNIVPKHRRSDPAYVLNQTIDKFTVTNCDLVAVFDSLTILPPKLISLYHPFLSDKTGAKLVNEIYHRQVGGKEMSFCYEKATFRDILNEIAREQGSMYWIAEPAESVNANIVVNTNVMGIRLYSLREARGWSVIYEHDPVLKERMRKHIEKLDNDYLENQAKLKQYLENHAQSSNTNKPAGSK